MSRGSGSEYRAFFKLLDQAGCTYRQARRSGHWLIYGPSGNLVSSLPSTPGDRRNMQNARHDLRRQGITLP